MDMLLYALETEDDAPAFETTAPAAIYREPERRAA